MFVNVVYQKPNFPGEYGENEYPYTTELTLAVGDKVIAPTRNGNSAAMVSEINLPEGRIDERWRDKLKEITEYLPAPEEKIE